MKKALSILVIACAANVVAAQTFVSDTLSEAVVTGTRGKAYLNTLPTTVSIIEHQTLAEAQRTSVLPTLSEQVVGLFVTSRALLGYGVSDGAAGGISIRGMQSGNGRVMVLIDGHPQYQGIFGHSIADAYQTLGVERIEVVRGPASMLYGSNGMGGVVNIITRQAPTRGTNTDYHAAWGSYGTFEASVANRVRTGKFHSNIGGQYARTDGHRPRLGFEEYNFIAKLGYDFSAHWQAEASTDVTYFRAEYPGSTQTPLFDARQKILRGQASVSLDNDYGFTAGRISVFHNWGNHKINDGHAAEAAPKANLFRSSDALSGLNFYQRAVLFNGNTLTVGFDWTRINGEAWNQRLSDGARVGTSIDTTLHELAAYIDVRQDITAWLTAEAGLRYDHHSQTGNTLVPQGGVSVRLPYNALVKATVGKGFRNPTLRELYMWTPANSSLKPERLMNYEIAFSQHLPQARLRYGINAYLLHADNLIQTAMIEDRPRNINTGEARNYGIEAEATWEVCPMLTLTTNHSFVYMHTPLLDTPRYKGYLAATYRSKRLQITLGGQAIGHLYTAVGETEKRESFVLLNAVVSYRLLPCMEVYAKGDNLLAQRYETRLGYPLPRTTFMAGLNLAF